jgi:hypothetical protein
MSICCSGLDTPGCVQPVTIDVSSAHPLIQLAQVIPWQALANMVLPDLKRTTAKGKWWLGRKLKLRIHSLPPMSVIIVPLTRPVDLTTLALTISQVAMRPRALLGPAPQEADGPVCTPPHDQEPCKGLPCPPCRVVAMLVAAAAQQRPAAGRAAREQH